MPIEIQVKNAANEVIAKSLVDDPHSVTMPSMLFEACSNAIGLVYGNSGKEPTSVTVTVTMPQPKKEKHVVRKPKPKK